MINKALTTLTLAPPPHLCVCTAAWPVAAAASWCVCTASSGRRCRCSSSPSSCCWWPLDAPPWLLLLLHRRRCCLPHRLPPRPGSAPRSSPAPIAGLEVEEKVQGSRVMFFFFYMFLASVVTEEELIHLGDWGQRALVPKKNCKIPAEYMNPTKSNVPFF